MEATVCMLAAVLGFGDITTKQETKVRAECETSGETVGVLPAGASVEVRFAMSGGAGQCYKVAATMDGKAVSGYVKADELSGLEEFRKGLEAAPAVGTASSAGGQGPGAVVDRRVEMPKVQVAAGHPLARANQMIVDKQPQAALELIEKSMAVNGRDYPHLVMAGIAAYQSDDVRRAVSYLRDADDLKRDDPMVKQLLARMQREQKADDRQEKLYGTRFQLRYEGTKVEPETARQMVAVLEEEFSRISTQLGCRTEEKIATIVQSRESYMAATGAAEWSGGRYDGTKIRVALLEGNRIGARTRQVFAHELVHACLSSLGQFPTWLHEGLAQKLSGEAPAAELRSTVKTAVKQGKLPKLGRMRGGWGGMSPEQASVAYAYAALAGEALLDRYAAYGLQNVLRYPERLAEVEAELDKVLAQ